MPYRKKRSLKHRASRFLRKNGMKVLYFLLFLTAGLAMISYAASSSCQPPVSSPAQDGSTQG